MVLEAWGAMLMACLVGFMGPFGTYGEGDLLVRVGHWSYFLLGAYVLVRPVIVLGNALAQRTGLPRRHVTTSCVLLSSVPLSFVWSWGGAVMFHSPMRYSVILPFSLICAFAVLIITIMAERMGRSIERAAAIEKSVQPPWSAVVASPAQGASAAVPRLRERLSPGFAGPILALQSEDHYVRVHGTGRAELVLMRLRDAIAEMDDVPGAQVHRSWWVARNAFDAGAETAKSRILRLTNGLEVPVARDSVERLRVAGFIGPAEKES